MKLTIALIAAVTFSSPASALTLQQAQNELAGMSCSGSTCTSKANGTVTTDNPDIVTTTKNPDVLTSTEVLVSPAVDRTNSRPLDLSIARGFWNERCQTFAEVNADCTVQALNQGSSGSPAVYATVVTATSGGTTTTVTDGGVTVSATCTTTSKELQYNGPNTSRDTAWSINTSSSTSDGAC